MDDTLKSLVDAAKKAIDAIEIHVDNTESSVGHVRWNVFVDSLKYLNDPLIAAIFHQATYKGIYEDQVEVELERKLEFFHDWIKSASEQWTPLFNDAFGEDAYLKIRYKDA